MRYPRIWSNTIFLLDQPKRRKSGLILQALQGRLCTPFLITSVAEGYTNQLAY
jgi:hypothetical protein